MHASHEESRPHGHVPTLIASLLHFDVCFTLWTLVGALSLFIGISTGLTPGRLAFLVAVPLLSGAVMRVPIGMLADRYGAKPTGTALLLFLYIPLALGFFAADDFAQLLAMAVTIGFAGASFAVALPLASRAFPPERQGVVLGVAAFGNSGTVLANLVAPRLAQHFGWHAVCAFAIVPLTVVLAAWLLSARERPVRERKTLSAFVQTATRPNMGWLCLFYSLTFGGFVGLSAFLPLFFKAQYALAPVEAGSITALAAFTGSLARPIGGYLADRLGSLQTLFALVVAIAIAYFALATLAPVPLMTMLVVGCMAMLGMGNGAVFRVAAERFSGEMGVASGVIGAAGGIGGFVLPIVLSSIRQASGSFSWAFAAFALFAASVAIAVRAFRGAPSRSISVSAIPTVHAAE
jgi:NNP family nitrate/nitrite transporter-like MFS transporter